MQTIVFQEKIIIQTLFKKKKLLSTKKKVLVNPNYRKVQVLSMSNQL
jgi:hypothetical protein